MRDLIWNRLAVCFNPDARAAVALAEWRAKVKEALEDTGSSTEMWPKFRTGYFLQSAPDTGDPVPAFIKQRRSSRTHESKG